MANSKHALSIFNVLNNIDKKNVKFYDNLDDSDKKGFVPLVVMRWLTGTTNAQQVYFINTFVNSYVFSLGKHPALLYKLMTICSPGRVSSYSWKKKISKKSTNLPETVRVVSDVFGYNTLDSIEAIALLSDIELIDYAEQLGRQVDVIRKIKKELKSR